MFEDRLAQDSPMIEALLNIEDDSFAVVDFQNELSQGDYHVRPFKTYNQVFCHQLL